VAIDNNNSRSAGGIDFNRVFGAAPAAQNGNTASATQGAKPKAKIWLNIGYTAAGAGREGEDMFVSLPVGIPLDTTEHLALRGSGDYREFLSARNDLLDQIMAAAGDLQPGEARTLNLEIQLRHVADEAAPVDPETNRFGRKLEL
jgi:hypothetical protein